MILNPFLKIWEIWAWSFLCIAFLRKGVSQLYENMRGYTSSCVILIPWTHHFLRCLCMTFENRMYKFKKSRNVSGLVSITIFKANVLLLYQLCLWELYLRNNVIRMIKRNAFCGKEDNWRSLSTKQTKMGEAVKEPVWNGKWNK